MSAESRRKMSIAAKNRLSNRIGKKHSAETRAKIAAVTLERTAKGEDHYAWKGGITTEQRRDRKSPGYKTWRRQVRENAGDACEACQYTRPRRMHAHHIKSFATHPQLRIDPDNGGWVCDECHNEAHAPASLRYA